MSQTPEDANILRDPWLYLKQFASSGSQELNKHKEFWESALNTTFSDDQWLHACVFVNKYAISTRLQETSYKLLTNLYNTPIKINTQMDFYSFGSLLAQ